jgi:hypothetical protein
LAPVLPVKYQLQNEDIDQDDRGHGYDARSNGEPFDTEAAEEWQVGWREGDDELSGNEDAEF